MSKDRSKISLFEGNETNYFASIFPENIRRKLRVPFLCVGWGRGERRVEAN